VKLRTSEAASSDARGAQADRYRGASALEGLSALNLAIANAHYDLAAALLDAGANPNHDVVGSTPLHQLMMTRRPNPEAVVYAVPLTARLDSIARRSSPRRISTPIRRPSRAPLRGPAGGTASHVLGLTAGFRTVFRAHPRRHAILPPYGLAPKPELSFTLEDLVCPASVASGASWSPLDSC
jgi:hypothetical protein